MAESESIELIENTLIEHSKNLTALIETQNAVISWAKSITMDMQFITKQILKHRLIEFEKPKHTLKGLETQVVELEGMARYTLDAVNRLLPLQEKLESHLQSSKRKLIYTIKEG